MRERERERDILTFLTWRTVISPSPPALQHCAHTRPFSGRQSWIPRTRTWTTKSQERPSSLKVVRMIAILPFRSPTHEQSGEEEAGLPMACGRRVSLVVPSTPCTSRGREMGREERRRPSLLTTTSGRWKEEDCRIRKSDRLRML